MAYRGFKPSFMRWELVAATQLLLGPWLTTFAYVWVSGDNIDHRATDVSALVRLFRLPKLFF